MGKLEHCDRSVKVSHTYILDNVPDHAGRLFPGTERLNIKTGQCSHCFKRAIAFQRLDLFGGVLTEGGYQNATKREWTKLNELIDLGVAIWEPYIPEDHKDTRGRNIGQSEYSAKVSKDNNRAYVLRVVKVQNENRTHSNQRAKRGEIQSAENLRIRPRRPEAISL